MPKVTNFKIKNEYNNLKRISKWHTKKYLKLWKKPKHLYNHGDWFYGAHLKYLGYNLGTIMLKYKYGYDRDTQESWKYDPYVLLSLNTKVTFTMKSTFTKSNMRHEIKINLNVRRQMSTSDKDYKKFIDWAKLIMKQLKTAEAKKRKFQADVDFE